MPQLHLQVLGALQVTADDVPIRIAGALKHRLLCRLALNPGSSVSADALIDALWGENAPRTARQSLHVHISHVRDRLRSLDADRLLATTVDGRYVLGIDGVTIDAVMFENLVENGLAARLGNNLRSAHDQLRDALALWGEPFESLAGDYGAMAQRQRLAAIHERGLDAYADTLIDLGRSDEALTVLREAVATAPLREHPYEQLMQIYLQRAERALAIDVYEQASAVFGDQLGIEPSARLRNLRENLKDDRIVAAASMASRVGANRVEQTSTRSVLAWPPDQTIDLGRSGLFFVTDNADTTSLVEALRASAGRDRRRVAFGRVLANAVSPLSPITELAGFDAEPGTSRSPQLRAELFDRISYRLVREHFLTPIVLLEGFEHASPVLLEYVAHALTRPGPAPFTLVLLATRLPETGLPEPLAEALVQRGSIDLPPTRVADTTRFDPDERSVLILLSCASLPAPTELIARSSDRGAIEVAAAVDRLAARHIVTVEGDGRLGLRHPEHTKAQLAIATTERVDAHLALADAVQHLDSMGTAQRAVSRTHHLMNALPKAPWADAASALRASIDYLETLGAYDDIIALCLCGPPPDEWPDEGTTLPLRIALGRAQMRTGRIDDGRTTLERCLDMARVEEHGGWFGEALRALLEERAPQTLDDRARDLIGEALALMDASPSETRVQLMTDMANSRYFTDPDEAERWANQALELARRGVPSTLARALTGVIQAKLRPDNATERLELALEAQRWARQADSTETLVLALTYEAQALMDLGELRRADPPLRYASALATELQVPRFRWWAAAWSALLDFALGDLDAAERGFSAAYELWPSETSFDPFECLASQLSGLRFVQGRGAELVSVLAPLTGPDARVEYLATGALAFAQAGDYDKAKDALRRVLAPDGLGHRRDTIVPFALALAAEAAFAIEATDLGESLVGRIEPLRDIHTTLNVWGGGGFYWGALRHGYGLALALAGRPDQARAELQRAAADQDAAGATVFAERSRSALRSLAPPTPHL